MRLINMKTLLGLIAAALLALTFGAPANAAAPVKPATPKQANVTCPHETVGRDYDPPLNYINDDQFWTTGILGGWRELTGPAGSTSMLETQDLQWSGTPTVTHSAMRMQIHNSSGVVSSGPWFDIPALPTSGWDNLWILSGTHWLNNTGNFWRIEVDGPLGPTYQNFATRCSSA